MDNQLPTKKEKYLLKKEEKEKNQNAGERRRKIKKAVIFSILTLAILSVAIAVSFKTINYFSKKDTGGTPKIEITPAEYDFGTVSMVAGPVKTTYLVKNKGEGPLKIKSIWTSCHCTTAILKVGGKESPKFGMDNNPKFWSQEIMPGQTGELEVTFDSAFHGTEAVGFAVRAIYLSTNDPGAKKAEVIMTADVVR